MSQQVAEYVKLHKELLSLERDAELAETALSSEGAKLSALESSGLAITRLSNHPTTTTAGGRAIVRLSTRGGRQLSAARITSGDIVGVRAHGAGDMVEGVVTRLEETSIFVSLDDGIEEEEGGLFMVVKMTSNVTHKRYTAALGKLESVVGDPTHVAYNLVRVLLDGTGARFVEEVAEVAEELFQGLNEKQKEAVGRALRAKDLSVVHGPPGTGKTHTIAAYILAEVARGSRVLVVAPSNVAVDNVAERLAGSGRNIKFVRAGHPARIIPSVVKYGLEAQLMKTEEAALTRDIRKELGELEGKVAKTKEKGGRKAIRMEQRELRKELRKREKGAVKRLLGSMDVVLATISGAGARVLDIAENVQPFDVVVVDEAAQALEAACWVPLLRSKKALLAGDPYQLAGTVKCMAAEERGLKKSILDRVFAAPGLESCVTMLATQYRMNSIISTWSSQEFYDGNLVADSAVAEHRVADLESCTAEVEDDQNLVNPFIVIDTAGGDCEEDDLSEEIVRDAAIASSKVANASRSNKGEAEIVSRIVSEFIKCGLSRQEIAVISPYSGQVELLRRLIWPAHGRSLEVATIDSFQGREKEVVCMSLVRSNEEGNVGFLSDNRRLNVAITRARRCVIIVCDSETVSSHPLLLRMIEYAENFGHYRSAVTDFPDIVGTESLQRRPKEALEAEQRSNLKQKRKPKSKPRKKEHTPSASHPRQHSRGDILGDRDHAKDTEDIIDLKDKLRSEVLLFSNNSNFTEKVFPSNLSSLARRLIHELAEELQFGHETADVERGRQIRIWKRDIPDQGTNTSIRNAEMHESEESTEVEPINDRAHTSMFEILDSTESVDVTEKQSAPTVEGSTATSNLEIAVEYQDANSVLREARLAREARSPGIDVGNAEAVAVEGPTIQGVRKKGKKNKRRGKVSNASDTDDDFDAVLAKYGAPRRADGAGSTTDLVRQIMEGKIQLKAPAPKVNTQAKQRLASKLAQEAEKRSRKSKAKK